MKSKEAKQTPKTLSEWDNFMNGYRDPLSRAEHKRKAEELINGEDAEFWQDRYNGGGGGSMGSGGESERECGFRKEGGTYAVVPTGANGLPLESFLLCKPKAIDRAEYNLTNVGVNLVDIPEANGEIVTHIFDIVGADNYPNIADFLEETRRLGVSRRLELETAAQYARLSPKSRLILLHSKAVIENPGDIYKAMGETEILRLQRAGCPKALKEHTIKGEKAFLPIEANDAPGCSALYWNVLEGGLSIPEHREDGGGILDAEILEDVKGRFVTRKLSSGSYRGYSLPEEVKVKYSLGIFAIFPLARIEVVDPNGEYEERVKRASAARIDVEATDC